MSEQKRKAVDEDAPDGITADGERLDKRAKSSSKFLSTMKPFLELRIATATRQRPALLEVQQTRPLSQVTLC